MLPDPASRIALWQKGSGRHDLPWQDSLDPYRIWLSEIMLQQTQATTVIPYFERFLALFPDVRTLAHAPLDAVLLAWAGLGYYARARNLHRCAQQVCDQYDGRFPDTPEALASLPGIGRSTAAAIAAFAYGTRAAILDGNVRRVLARHRAFEGDPGTSTMQRTLWATAEQWLAQAPTDLDMRAYTQGQMDLGATICTRHQPDCDHCPIAADCLARRQGRQADLPTPRARRDQPQRHAWVLILVCQGRILLRRRPPEGIWGGLWSLPQFDSAATLEHARTTLPGALDAAQELAAIQHVFTHFRLRLQPRLVVSMTPSPQSDDPDLAWVAVQALSDYGMPAPIARLLEGLHETLSAP